MSGNGDQETIRSRQRVADHGEVFTSEREVGAMLDLVLEETRRIDSRFLEPACGTGNFLVETLRRKLRRVEELHGRTRLEFERHCAIAVGSIYGIELLPDNVEQCRERLYACFCEVYERLFGDSCKEGFRETVRFILGKNIVQGDALEESRGKLTMSEWSMVNGSMVKRRDYDFRDLLSHQPIEGENLFSDLGERAFVPKPVREYPPTHFLELKGHG